MGIISKGVLEGTLLAFHVLGGCFCGVVLYYIFRAVKGVEQRQRESGRAQPFLKVLCPWLCGCCTASQLMLRFTLATVCFFMLYYVAGTLYRVVYFSVCKEDTCDVRFITWLFFCAGVVFGYPLMFVTHFERLRVTFCGSTECLPLWAPKLMYFDLLFFVVAYFGVVIFRWSFPILSAACLALVALLYLATVGALIGSFYKKTMAVAQRCDENVALFATAARMTIVVTVSLLSTTLSMIFWVFLIALCSGCHFWMLISNVLTTLDLSINAFCLLCTFGSAKKPYKWLFGRMHAAFLRHATPSKERRTAFVPKDAMPLKHATDTKAKVKRIPSATV